MRGSVKELLTGLQIRNAAGWDRWETPSRICCHSEPKNPSRRCCARSLNSGGISRSEAKSGVAVELRTAPAGPQRRISTPPAPLTDPLFVPFQKAAPPPSQHSHHLNCPPTPPQRSSLLRKHPHVFPIMPPEGVKALTWVPLRGG